MTRTGPVHHIAAVSGPRLLPYILITWAEFRPREQGPTLQSSSPPPQLTPQRSRPDSDMPQLSPHGEPRRRDEDRHGISGDPTLLPPPEAATGRLDGPPGSITSGETRDLGLLLSRLRFVLRRRIVVNGLVMSEISYPLTSANPNELINLVLRGRRELNLVNHKYLRFNLYFGFILRGGEGNDVWYTYRSPGPNYGLRRRFYLFHPGRPLTELRRDLEQKDLSEVLSRNVAENSREIIQAIVQVQIRFLHPPQIPQ